MVNLFTIALDFDKGNFKIKVHDIITDNFNEKAINKAITKYDNEITNLVNNLITFIDNCDKEA